MRRRAGAPPPRSPGPSPGLFPRSPGLSRPYPHLLSWPPAWPWPRLLQEPQGGLTGSPGDPWFWPVPPRPPGGWQYEHFPSAKASDTVVPIPGESLFWGGCSCGYRWRGRGPYRLWEDPAVHTCRPVARRGQCPVDRADNWTPKWEGFLRRESRLRTRLQQLSLSLSLGPCPLPHLPSERAKLLDAATQTSGRPPMASLSFTDFLSWALKNLMGLARATVRSGCIGASWAWYGDVPGSPPHPHLP